MEEIKNIGDLLNQNLEEIKKKKKTSERAEIIKEIYDIYISPSQKAHRRKENWKRYCEWCRSNRKPNTPESQSLFKKSKSFIKEHSVKTICVFIAHIPTADLYYILSVAKDMKNRGENFSGYFISSVFPKKEQSY